MQIFINRSKTNRFFLMPEIKTNLFLEQKNKEKKNERNQKHSDLIKFFY